jgi:hypothetical protein
VLLALVVLVLAFAVAVAYLMNGGNLEVALGI